MGYVDMPKSNTWQCLVLLLSSQLLSVISQQGQVVYSSCQNLRGNFTIDSSYEVNLKSLISSLSSLPQNENGFYNVSVGETDDDKVNSLMLCRGDVKPIDCIRCIVIAGQEIRERCPNQREANIWYDHCMLRIFLPSSYNKFPEVHGKVVVITRNEKQKYSDKDVLQ
ncbi:Cysteine-rich receptor-like protein kinase 26 [Cardamine amara subsp. amara]|uniref:Cysteine-rich receptor-like protein kinase 26 n=1 Tax=Cardamine amara subsp. amara TaxID=228776 RepID=A0ABD0ZR33_CARAN